MESVFLCASARTQPRPQLGVTSGFARHGKRSTSRVSRCAPGLAAASLLLSQLLKDSERWREEKRRSATRERKTPALFQHGSF